MTRPTTPKRPTVRRGRWLWVCADPVWGDVFFFTTRPVFTNGEWRAKHRPDIACEEQVGEFTNLRLRPGECRRVRFSVEVKP
jgi:hypothetical protein